MSALIKSLADIGIERYGTKEITDRMKPINLKLKEDDGLLAFAKEVSLLFQEPSESIPTSSIYSKTSN